MIRVVLPYHLSNLANIQREVQIQLESAPGSVATLGDVLDTLEQRYPVLRGTIRDQSTKQRRAFIRFFACGQDWSLEPQDTVLPERVLSGVEPLRVVGAMAGG